MKPQKSIAVIIVLLFSFSAFSQNYKFGKVSKEELQEQFYPLDSSANAVYLYKQRRTYTAVMGNRLQLVTEIQTRLKIYNKEGFKWATEEISLFGSSNSNSENVSGLKAYTYNLEGNEIVETKLDKDNVFDEEKSENWSVKKFTMPNLKEGSVVEWTYKVMSPFVSYIDDVVVQYEIPVKYLEAKVQLLEWLYFNKRQKGYYFFKINEESKLNLDLRTNDRLIEIVEKDVPAIKEEPFVNNLNNYTSALQLEVASLNAPQLGLFENYATSWEEISKDIYKSSSFGGQLDKTGHLKDDLAVLKTKLTTPEQKIAGALQFVKSKIKWNGNYHQYAEKGVKKAYQDGSGNVGDINLTLVAILRELGLKAYPVLVSTRSHGIPIFPTSRGFNYVIAAVELDKTVVLLDATNQYSIPNVLPLRALNWEGRIVRENGSSSPVGLFPPEPSKEVVFANFKIDDEGMVNGMSRTSYTGLGALTYREKNNSLSDDELIKNIESDHPNLEITEIDVQNKEDLGKPVMENLKFDLENHVEIIGNKMYFSPLFIFKETENPFKLEKREFPIDFGTPWNRKYTISIDIPEGYSVETVPENASVAMPDNLGSYKYITSVAGNKFQLMCEVEINSPIVSSNYYTELKHFYKLLLDKELEKVVLTKN